MKSRARGAGDAQGLLKERTVAYRPFPAVAIFRAEVYPKLKDVLVLRDLPDPAPQPRRNHEDACATRSRRRPADHRACRLGTKSDRGTGARRDCAVVQPVQPTRPRRYEDLAGTNPHCGLRVLLGLSAR